MQIPILFKHRALTLTFSFAQRIYRKYLKILQIGPELLGGFDDHFEKQRKIDKNQKFSDFAPNYRHIICY